MILGSVALAVLVLLARTLLRVSPRAVDDVEVILGNLTAQHHVLGSSFDPRQDERLRELVFAQASLGLRGQHTVDERQRVAVAVVRFLIKAGK